MELDSLECVSSSDGMDEDEAAAGVHLPHAFTKVHVGNGIAGGNGNNVSGVAPPGIPPVTSVHELLECPVCTNSMYPPIHQFRGRSISFEGEDEDASTTQTSSAIDWILLPAVASEQFC